MRRLLPLLAILLVLARPIEAAKLRSVEVNGTEFKVTLSDGKILRSRELIGKRLVMTLQGRIVRVRIDAVERDPDAKAGDVWLHTFSVQQADGSWQNLCKAGPDGRRQGFPIAGRPRQPDGALQSAEPGIFDLTCTAGGRGKCVRFGYRPWESAAAADQFNACVRMLRADYCGEGVGTTRDGTIIDLYDDRRTQISESGPDFVFEAGWAATGAVCVRHVRIKQNISLERLVAVCPRLKGRVGEMCTEEKARSLGALLFNRSRP